MEDSTKCPVCGREGIPDYRQGEVRCPSCGSNLEVFRLLDSIEEDSKAKASKWKPIALVSMALALVFAMLYLTSGGSTADATEEKPKAQAEATQTVAEAPAAPAADTATAKAKPAAEKGKDETKAATDKADEKDDVTAPADKVTVKDGKKYYTVTKGDSWWKICQKLYKGKVKDADLARLNGRKATDQLEIGEVLLVK